MEAAGSAEGDGSPGDRDSLIDEQAPPVKGVQHRVDDASMQPALAAAGSTPRYPLNIPDLPYNRYHHRRLGARDIMVHRIMQDFMNPTRVKPSVYTNYIRPSDFFFEKMPDTRLSMDLSALNKMLFTSGPYIGDGSGPLFVLYPRRKGNRDEPVHGLGPHPKPPSLGDVILDMVRRYYLETDDSAFRLWIQAADTPRPAEMGFARGREIPSNNLTSSPIRRRTQASLSFLGEIISQRMGESKPWFSGETVHLRSLKGAAATQQSYSLFDGGTFLPYVRQLAAHDTGQPRGPRNRDHWLLTRDTVPRLPTWPEPHLPVRFLIQPSWDQRYDWKRLRLSPGGRPLDLDANPGRGRNVDGCWSTGRGPRTTARATEPQTGRGRRIRPRSTSEPPPGLFAVAEFPRPKFETNSVDFEIAYPRMTLMQLDRRSRRRSLSRTRIAEMFDWDTNIDWIESKKTSISGPRDSGCKKPRRATAKAELAQSGKVSDGPKKDGADKVLRTPRGPTAKQLREPSHNTLNASPAEGRTSKSPKRSGPCANCRQVGHLTANCRHPCGHCGAQSPNRPAPPPIRCSHGHIHVQHPTHQPQPPPHHSSAANRPNSTTTPAMDAQQSHRLAVGVSYGFGTVTDATRRQAWDAPDLESDRSQPDEGVHQVAHLAPDCPLGRANRCKCVPFPTFHSAYACPVPCSRRCGNAAPPGSFRHRNAMTCRARCCMCGLRGHSGRDCRLKCCRCGVTGHLGQDCRWKVECPAKGCDRFLCGMHCRSCGSAEKPFAGWTCRRCLGQEGESKEGETTRGRKGRGRRRRRDGFQGDGEGRKSRETTRDCTGEDAANTSHRSGTGAMSNRNAPEEGRRRSVETAGYKSIFS